MEDPLPFTSAFQTYKDSATDHTGNPANVHVFDGRRQGGSSQSGSFAGPNSPHGNDCGVPPSPESQPESQSSYSLNNQCLESPRIVPPSAFDFHTQSAPNLANLTLARSRSLGQDALAEARTNSLVDLLEKVAIIDDEPGLTNHHSLPFSCSSAADLAAFLEDSFGAHLLDPPNRKGVSSCGRDSMDVNSRSSLELLLEGPSSTGTSSGRHSMDSIHGLGCSLNELLSPRWVGTVPPAIWQQANAISNAIGKFERRSADDGRGPMNTAAARLQGLSGQTVGPSLPKAAIRPITAGVVNDFASSSVTVVAKPTVPAPNVASLQSVNPGAVAGTTATSTASRLVDSGPSTRGLKSQKPSVPMPFAGYQDPAATALLLDADVHDTFGAHAWYLGGTTGSSLGTSNPSPGGSSAPGGLLAQTMRESSPLRTRGSGGSAAGGSMNLARLSPRGSGGAGTTTFNGGSAPLPTINASGTTAAGNAEDTPCSPLSNTSASTTSNSTYLGQNTLNAYDRFSAVPSYAYLKQRSLTKERLQSEGANWGGGYIAEAKKVLNDAMSTASRMEADLCEASYSGAIGPLMRYLKQNTVDDAALLSGLHTLALLVSNSPNRAIIAGFEGQSLLCDIMKRAGALTIKEQAVQILWDVSSPAAGEDKVEWALQPDDLLVLLSVLEETASAVTASHVLHLLNSCLQPPAAVQCNAAQLTDLAERLIKEVRSHKHHLQDAAQYSLGSLLAAVLGDKLVPLSVVQKGVDELLDSLLLCTSIEQCQVLLTVLSSLAGVYRVRTVMAEGSAKQKLLQFTRQTGESRMRARALSLSKVVSKEENLAGWYFGE